MSEAFRKVRDLYYRGGERYGRRDCTVLVEDGGTFVLVARDEDKLARRMDDGSLFRRPRCLRLRQVLPGGIPLMSTSRAVRQHGRLA